MQINANLDYLNSDDTVVFANNRQVLAFQYTWSIQRGASRLPKLFSWKQYLLECWELEKPEYPFRLITDDESRYLISKSITKFGHVAHTQLVDEVVKNNDYCCAHIIELSKLQNCKIEVVELYCRWIKEYRNIKRSLNLVDINDLTNLILKNKNKSKSIHVYGFNNPSPAQLSIFENAGYKVIESDKYNNTINRVFSTTHDEIRSAAVWARSMHSSDPSKSIAIVCPQLGSLYYQIKSTLDQEFDNLLTETGQKSFNISLGLPLIQYPLVQNLLSILDLSRQIKLNNIKKDTFAEVASSVYVTGHSTERNQRVLLLNKVLSLPTDNFKLSTIKKYLAKCPTMDDVIYRASKTTKGYDSYDVHLEEFNKTLQLWGFATSRPLSSVEYQLFNKYLETSLHLNRLSHYDKKVKYGDAMKELKRLLSKVIFQAKAGETKVQILGSLEADGLHFDEAWVMGMTKNFLPPKINSPRFIPFYISSEHGIPHCNYELASQDAQKTITNLQSLSKEVVFSYAINDNEEEQLPSPLVEFDDKIEQVNYKDTEILELQSIDDSITKDHESKKIRSGVTVLRDQMGCPFKGFVHRLNIDKFDTPSVGIDRREQGTIIHNALHYIYQDIRSHDCLTKLNRSELDKIIDSKINLALRDTSSSGFKKIEKIRVTELIRQFIEQDKLREGFEVLSTEETISTDIAGLVFDTRLDRLDKMPNGNKIVFDYKTGNTSISNWCNEYIREPQLPIYAVNNNTEGAAFIELKSNKVSFKGLSKDKESIPTQQRHKNSCQEWDEQVALWKIKLDAASRDFQHGVANVSPYKGACDNCENDSLCRVDK